MARGKAGYVSQRCRVCPSIDGDGNTRFPLDGVSDRLTDREIRLWIEALRLASLAQGIRRDAARHERALSRAEGRVEW